MRERLLADLTPHVALHPVFASTSAFEVERSECEPVHIRLMGRRLSSVAGGCWVMEMTTGDSCDFCRKGRVNWRMEQLSFRQSSDKGYVHCRTSLPVGTCDKCGAKTLQPDTDALFDEAFRREYGKLP